MRPLGALSTILLFTMTECVVSFPGVNITAERKAEGRPGFAADPALMIELALISILSPPPDAHRMPDAGALTIMLPAVRTLKAAVEFVASQKPIPISDAPLKGAVAADSRSNSIVLLAMSRVLTGRRAVGFMVMPFVL